MRRIWFEHIDRTPKARIALCGLSLVATLAACSEQDNTRKPPRPTAMRADANLILANVTAPTAVSRSEAKEETDVFRVMPLSSAAQAR